MAVGVLEFAQQAAKAQVIELKLLLDDQDGRSMRNNLCIKGLPGTEGMEDLAALLQALFGLTLDRQCYQLK